MPSLSRRRDTDARNTERFESEVSSAQLKDPAFADKRKFSCSRCGQMFEERSRFCPRCDSHTMGELKKLTPSEQERKNSIARARHGRGAHLPGQG